MWGASRAGGHSWMPRANDRPFPTTVPVGWRAPSPSPIAAGVYKSACLLLDCPGRVAWPPWGWFPYPAQPPTPPLGPVQKVTGQAFPGEFGESLRDGVILCKLVNVIKPGSIKKVHESGECQCQLSATTVPPPDGRNHA